MTFVPPSSFVPATVTIGGTVAVSNFPASQPVTGPLTAAELAALEPLSVTGPLTDAQLAARLPLSVDGSGVTQPVSADSLPLPDGAADNQTLSEIALSAILARERGELH